MTYILEKYSAMNLFARITTRRSSSHVLLFGTERNVNMALRVFCRIHTLLTHTGVIFHMRSNKIAICTPVTYHQSNIHKSYNEDE